MHFYSISTCFSLSKQPQVQYLWQRTIPQIAFSHTFLLDGLLAITSLHLTLERPEQRDIYISMANHYHAKAIPQFRVAIGRVNQQNCEACFAFSIVLVVFDWASRGPSAVFFPGSTLSPADRTNIGGLRLLRSTSKLVAVGHEWILESRLKAILRPWNDRLLPPAQLNDTVQERLLALKQM